jgi:hypothetical protein
MKPLIVSGNDNPIFDRLWQEMDGCPYGGFHPLKVLVWDMLRRRIWNDLVVAL